MPKKSLYNDFGGFNTAFRIAADFELMLRFIEKNRIRTRYLGQMSCRYARRRHKHTQPAQHHRRKPRSDEGFHRQRNKGLAALSSHEGFCPKSMDCLPTTCYPHYCQTVATADFHSRHDRMKIQTHSKYPTFNNRGGIPDPRNQGNRGH